MSESIEEHDFEYDEITGERGKKPKMAILNKGKLSRYEMDDLFLGDEPTESE